MNIAQDVSINQFILGLPKDAITLEKLSQELGKKLEPERGAWYYYKEIQDFNESHSGESKFPNLDNNRKSNNFDNIDDHTLWPKETSEAERKLYENQIKSKIKETAEIISKQAGSIPGEFNEILKRIQDKPPVFNWKKYFRRLIGNSITNNIELTRLKPSKRFPDARGIRLQRKPSILVGVDVSGSINIKDFEDFFNEIDYIYKSGTHVTVVECDTKIQNVFEYRGQQDIKINGRGGTILNDIIEYYKQHKDYSCCILFTDGYCNTIMPSCQNLIWVISSNGSKSQKYSPGKVILIP